MCLPHLPRRMAAVPELLEPVLVALRIHAAPESVVRIAGELALEGKAFHGNSRKVLRRPILTIGADVVEHLWLAHHKAAVDERLVSRSLLAEGPHHSRIVHVKHAKALANDDPGEGDHRAMRPVERDDVIGVHVGYAVTIGEEKGLVAHILLDALDAPGSKGIQAGVRDGDAPRLGSRGVNLYVFRPIAVVKGNV